MCLVESSSFYSFEVSLPFGEEVYSDISGSGKKNLTPEHGSFIALITMSWKQYSEGFAFRLCSLKN